LVLDNAAVDVAGAASSSTPVSATGRVSDQGFTELMEACAFFFEPGLQLIELLEVRAVSSCGGRCYPPGSRIGPGSRVGRWGRILLPRGSCAPLGVMRRPSYFQVEAFSRRVIAPVVRVGVAETVVAGLQEAHEGLRVTTPGKVSAGPLVVA